MPEITSIGYDMDITLVDVQPCFDLFHGIAIGMIADAAWEDPDVVKGKFRLAWRKSYEKFSVDPDWLIAFTIQQLGLSYPKIASEVWRRVGHTLDAVYYEPLKLFDDVLETVDAVAARGIEQGIITHRHGEWAMRTINQHPELKRHIKYGKAFAWKPRKTKDEHAWTEGAKYYNFALSQMAMIGDNLDADAISADRANVRLPMWLDRSEDSWLVKHVNKDLVNAKLIQNPRVFRVTSLRQMLWLIS